MLAGWLDVCWSASFSTSGSICHTPSSRRRRHRLHTEADVQREIPAAKKLVYAARVLMANRGLSHCLD